MRHVVQACSQIVKQFAQITMLRNRFGHLKQRLGTRGEELLESGLASGFAHIPEDSTALHSAQMGASERARRPWPRRRAALANAPTANKSRGPISPIFLVDRAGPVPHNYAIKCINPGRLRLGQPKTLSSRTDPQIDQDRKSTRLN